VVYRRGEPARTFYGICDGLVRFSAASPGSKDVVLGVFGPGQWFGEIGVFDGGPRAVDATAAETATLYALEQRDLLELCHEEPGLLLRFVERFSRSVRVAEDSIIDSSFLRPEARLAKRLLAFCDNDGCIEATERGPSIRVALDEVVSMAGITPENAGRQLKSWERDGLVSCDYGRVVLVDIPRLRLVVSNTARE
jgi:CRP-like cAMP-binding protein